jgi:single-strand DNA-binding protein
LNNISLIGRLTKQCELRYTQGGAAVASFTLAVDRRFKNQNGEKETDFINCVAWKQTAEALGNFTDKGHRIGLTGRLQVRSYENQEGKRVYVSEVVADQIEFLEPRQQGQQQQNQQPQGNSRVDEDPFRNDGQINISDDDLPF